MAALNLSTNGPSISSSYNSVVNSSAPAGPAASSPTYGQWAVFSVAAPLVSAFQGDAGKESTLKVQSTGEGELVDLIEEFSDGRIQFAFVKVKDPNTGLPKFALIGWCGEGVPERTKGYFSSHQAAVAKVLHGYHVQISARSDRDLTPEGIIQKVSDASGAKYSASSSAAPSTRAAPPPTVAKKPVFTPSTSSAGRGFNPLASRRAAPSSGPVDEDGWGEDAPQVTRTQIQKVDSAYKPTKVDMRSLTSQPTSTTSGPGANSSDRPDVVRGAYQPVGKVDIAAIRQQAQNNGNAKDDRPSIVKGAYEPVGKVDIAAIRARAQAPGSSAPVPAAVSPARTGASDADQEQPKSLADRSSAFQNQGRLAELPKPKVANKFGGGTSSYTGTKPLNPGTFGLQGPAPSAGPGLGTAGRSLAAAAVKTPAQIWAEKKAAQGGSVAPVSTPSSQPIASQPSGGWKSGYEGKKWGSVETSKTGASNASVERELDGPEPPALNSTTKPGFGGVAMPGMPIRPKEEEAPTLPPPPPQPPRSPTPEPEQEEEQSPIRMAVPVARQPEVEVEDAHEEQIRPPPALPVASIAKEASHEQLDDDEPETGPDPARQAAEGAAHATFGEEPTAETGSGQSAKVEYDYDAAEDNEITMVEGEIVTDIEMVDADWWLVTGPSGARGLVPSNYLSLMEGDEAPQQTHAPAPIPTVNEPEPEAPAAPSGHGATAVSLYDYEAAEDNELSFPEGAHITDIAFPDEDWWSGMYEGREGLFPASYVQLQE